MGNVRSLRNALGFAGADAVVTSDPAEILHAGRLLLPGVGAFGMAMENLRSRGLVEPLGKAVLDQGTPFLGICLGMQLLAESSEEHGRHDGLGWLRAEVRRFSQVSEGGPRKVPHTGWNRVDPLHAHPLFAGLDPRAMEFYFVHSFHIVCRDRDDAASETLYGYPFVSAVARGNIFASQFHPEKSQDNGVQMLRNFLEWNP